MKIDYRSALAVFEKISDGMYFVDPNRTITYWNKSAEKISGFTAQEVVGRSCSDNILTHINDDGESLCLGKCPLEKSILEAVPLETHVYMHHKDGHRIPVTLRSAPLFDGEGRIIGGVEIFSDTSIKTINEEKLKELETMAMTDKLTHLANRNYLENEFKRRIDEKQRYNSSFGVFFMDVDHFKSFNDTYGHDVGDRVLQHIAKTLLSNSRLSDLYGRWGGEEFIGIIQAVTLPNLHKMGQRIRILVENSYILHQGQPLYVTLSIGGTIARDNETMDQITKRADSYLYDCKNQGRNRVITG